MWESAVAVAGLASWRSAARHSPVQHAAQPQSCGVQPRWRTCLHTTMEATLLNPLLHTGTQLPCLSSSRRPDTRPVVLVALTRRAVTAAHSGAWRYSNK